MYVCVCVYFLFGKARHKQRANKKQFPKCGRQYWWRVLLSICSTSFFTHSSSSNYMSMRLYAMAISTRIGGVRSVRCVGCALLCHATGEITCLTLRHASLSAIRFVVISHKNTFRIRFSDFWTLNSLSSHSAQQTGGLITLSSMEKCIDRALSHVDFFRVTYGLRMRNVFL